MPLSVSERERLTALFQQRLADYKDREIELRAVRKARLISHFAIRKKELTKEAKAPMILEANKRHDEKYRLNPWFLVARY